MLQSSVDVLQGFNGLKSDRQPLADRWFDNVQFWMRPSAVRKREGERERERERKI